MRAIRSLTVTITAVAIVTAAGVVAAPAQAASFPGGSTFPSLALAIDSANSNPGADTITLDSGATITADAEFVIAGDLTIDLNGGTVDARRVSIIGSDLLLTNGTWIADGSIGNTEGIAVAPSATLTIESATIEAYGGNGFAGIGGPVDTPPGPITIRDSTVTAIGGAGGSGIGGSAGVDAGLVIFDSSVITASSASGTGIGGGSAARGGTTIIRNSLVTATGTGGNAGIGNAATQTSGSPTTELEGSSTLTALSINGSVTVADGAFATLDADPTTLDGSLTNNGELTLDRGLTLPGDSTLTNNGRISGGGPLTGEGTVTNNGSMCVSSISDEANNPIDGMTTGLTVTGNAFYLPYRYPEGFTVGNAIYAPTMQEGCRGFPDASIPPSDISSGQINVGWSLTQDGSSGFVTETTPLIDVAPSKTGTFYPLFASASLNVTPQSVFVRAGETVEFTVRGPVALSNAVSSDLTFFTEFEDIGQQFGDEPSTMTFTDAGEFGFRATVLWSINGGTEYEMTGNVAVFVQPADLTELEVTASATTVPQGDSITLDVGGRDEFGNTITIPADDITITSDVATDVIDGLTVTFPTASPHTLTVTVGEVSATVVIEVEPAAVIPNPGPSGPIVGPAPVAPSGPDEPGDDSLAATGALDGAGTALGALAILLLAVGAAAVRGGRRTRIRMMR